jgi:hypothetical protein
VEAVGGRIRVRRIPLGPPEAGDGALHDGVHGNNPLFFHDLFHVDPFGNICHGFRQGHTGLKRGGGFRLCDAPGYSWVVRISRQRGETDLIISDGVVKMAIVKRLEPMRLERPSRHTEVHCTYSIFKDAEGFKCLQIDTYGSKICDRPDKKNQSVRFGPEAIKQLKFILNNEF